MPQELEALSVDGAKLRNATAQSVLHSAAFYHVRFENIHPLYDGNGRVGRLITMGQLRQSLKFSPVEFERRLMLERDAYRAAFKLDGGLGTFRGMAMLLSRITGVPVDSDSLNLTLQLGPLRQSKGKPRR
ncbi:MAG TPA: Fic family protein [Opitutaceae bacterium]